MNWYDMWLGVGWSIFALIILGCIILSYAMWRDTENRKARNIAAPSLTGATDETVFSEGDKTVTRKDRRKKRRNNNVDIEASDASSLWKDDDNFSLSNGQD